MFDLGHTRSEFCRHLGRFEEFDRELCTAVYIFHFSGRLVRHMELKGSRKPGWSGGGGLADPLKFVADVRIAYGPYENRRIMLHEKLDF